MNSSGSRYPARSETLRLRNLRYHVRRWGDPAASVIFVGHGWLDNSATFQLLIEPLSAHLGTNWQFIAPDWRGCGYSQNAPGGYWFPDYVADLDALVAHYAPEAPAVMIGHSMGAQIMSLYAGIRPQRVKALVCLDGLFSPDVPPTLAGERAGQWLDQLLDLPTAGEVTSLGTFARILMRRHPRLGEEAAHFVARCWSVEDGHGARRVHGDPLHRLRGPSLYREAESLAVWQAVTAPTLFVDGADSHLRPWISAEAREARLACFRHRTAYLLDGCGHMLHFEAPERTAELVAEFLT